MNFIVYIAIKVTYQSKLTCLQCWKGDIFDDFFMQANTLVAMRKLTVMQWQTYSRLILLLLLYYYKAVEFTVV